MNKIPQRATQTTLPSCPVPSKHSQEASSSKSKNSSLNDSSRNVGRWTQEQCRQYIKLYQVYGKDYKQIAMRMPTRTAEQVRSHAQKYHNKHQRQQDNEMQVKIAKEMMIKHPNAIITRQKKSERQGSQEESLSGHLSKNQCEPCQDEKPIKSQVVPRAEKKKQKNTQQDERGTSLDKQGISDRTAKTIKAKDQQIICDPQLMIPKLESVNPRSFFYTAVLPFIIPGQPTPWLFDGYGPEYFHQELTTSSYNNSRSEPKLQDPNSNIGFVSVSQFSAGSENNPFTQLRMTGEQPRAVSSTSIFGRIPDQSRKPQLKSLTSLRR